MASAEFVVDDRVRLIGTDTTQTVRQYNPETVEYLIEVPMTRPACGYWESIWSA